MSILVAKAKASEFDLPKGNAMTISQTFHSGNTSGVLVGNTLHILKESKSRFWLWTRAGRIGQYCCIMDCCDNGIQDDVRNVVLEAKRNGYVARIMVRGGKEDMEIYGIPVEDIIITCNGEGKESIKEHWLISYSYLPYYMDCVTEIVFKEN